jgi:hypothetical protein
MGISSSRPITVLSLFSRCYRAVFIHPTPYPLHPLFVRNVLNNWYNYPALPVLNCSAYRLLFVCFYVTSCYFNTTPTIPKNCPVCEESG